MGAPRLGPLFSLLLLLLLVAAAGSSLGLPLNTTHPAHTRTRATLLQLCAIKVRGYNTPPEIDYDLDPLHKYLPEEVDASLRIEAPRLGATLPMGCHDVGRIGHKTLQCTGMNITKIPDLSLERNVDSLVFERTGIQVVRDVNHLPRTVRDLTFSHGPLVTFNGLRFYQVSGLTSLSLKHNTLTTWSFVTAFYSPDAPRNASIRVLQLDNNLITYPPDPIGSNVSVLPLLETLVMSHNPLSNLPGNLFLPLQASNLVSLFLKNCSLSQFYGSPLEPVSGIQILDLSYNPGLSKEELTDLFAPLQKGRLKDLYLANNNYVTVPTDALKMVSGTLVSLDLHGSALQCLDNTSFPLLPQLKELNLMYCRIASIRPHTFEVFPVLEILKLDGNALMTIPMEVLLPTLKVLTMSDNPRNTGDNEVAAFSMDLVDLSHMESLTNVTLEKAPLRFVRKPFFNDLRGLIELRLTSCKISYIEPLSFVNMTSLQSLHLNNNELEALFNETFTGLVSLLYLDLSNNRISFRSSTNFSPGTHRLPNPSESNPNQPSSPFDVPIAILDRVAGMRELKATNGDENPVTGNSQSQTTMYFPFEGLEALKYLDLSDNEIRYVASIYWGDLEQLATLSLMNNNIQEWYTPAFYNMSHLTQLVLSSNSLSHLTQAMVSDFSLPTLTAVDLRDNVFQCECSLSKLNELLNTSVFVDFALYTCRHEGQDLLMEGFISNVTCSSASLGPVEESPEGTVTMGIVLIAVSLLFTVITSVALYRKRWYLRYLVYKVKMKADPYKEDAEHYLYDIFVCYSQADRQWVFEHLVARLEDGGRYRVCVHERDFTVGQEITENIITAVDRSRKVVVVLSPAFVESSWCMLELQLASNKILDERRNKLILVLFRPLPHHCQPKRLKFLLRSRTYLAWYPDPEGQRLFWVRLQRAITKPTASEVLHLTHM